jgi:hypothetical protein
MDSALFHIRTYNSGNNLELGIVLYDAVLIEKSLLPPGMQAVLEAASALADSWLPGFDFVADIINFVEALHTNIPKTLPTGSVFPEFDFLRNQGEGDAYYTTSRDYYLREAHFWPLLFPHVDALFFPPSIALSVTAGIIITYTAMTDVVETIPWLDPTYRDKVTDKDYRILWPDNPAYTGRLGMTIAIRWQAPGDFWYYMADPFFCGRWVLGEGGSPSGSLFQPDGKNYISTISLSPEGTMECILSSGSGLCPSPWAVSWYDDPYYQPGGDDVDFQKVAGGQGYWEWKCKNDGFAIPRGNNDQNLPAYVVWPPYKCLGTGMLTNLVALAALAAIKPHEPKKRRKKRRRGKLWQQ